MAPARTKPTMVAAMMAVMVATDNGKERAARLSFHKIVSHDPSPHSSMSSCTHFTVYSTLPLLYLMVAIQACSCSCSVM